MSRPISLAYKTRNWPAHNEALKRRGSLTIWFDPAMVWEAAPTGKRGRQPDYSDATMQVLIAEGMVEKIDVFAMPNFTHVDEKWREVYWDPQREFSAPWAWGSTAFAVDTAVVTADISSLAVLFGPTEDVKGRINMLRDMNDVINMAEPYLGILRCSESPEEMKRLRHAGAG